jgi:hypothetical protein
LLLRKSTRIFFQKLKLQKQKKIKEKKTHANKAANVFENITVSCVVDKKKKEINL